MVLIGYKKCMPVGKHGERVVGVFEIPDDAIICPKRTNDFARYRVNKCTLIRVEDVYGGFLHNLDKVQGVSFSRKDPSLIFEKDKLIEMPEFVENENRFDTGILMFFSRFRAQDYLLEYVNEGSLTRWRDDGSVYSIENFLNERKHGFCKYYYINGQIKEESEYFHGNLMNNQTFYDISGNITKRVNYNNVQILSENKYT